jgi:putative hydrolase of the HAD superfamily
MCAAFGIAPAESLFADDMARNLKPAHDIGMATLWIDNGSEQGADPDRSFIDFTTGDLTRWLHDLMETA